MGPLISRLPLSPDLRMRLTGCTDNQSRIQSSLSESLTTFGSPPVQVILTDSPGVRLVNILVITRLWAAARASMEAPARRVLKKCMMSNWVLTLLSVCNERLESLGCIRKS